VISIPVPFNKSKLDTNVDSDADHGKDIKDKVKEKDNKEVPVYSTSKLERRKSSSSSLIWLLLLPLERRIKMINFVKKTRKKLLPKK
jgi:hypothetical protein